MPLGSRRNRLAQPQGVQRLQGLLDRRRTGYPAPRQEHHRRGGEDHRHRHDPHGPQPRKDHDPRRAFRRDLPEPDTRTLALARKHPQVPRHEDRLLADARRRRAARSRLARQVRLHERHHGQGAGRHRRQLPDGRVAEPRGAQDHVDGHRPRGQRGCRPGARHRPRLGPHRRSPAQQEGPETRPSCCC